MAQIEEIIAQLKELPDKLETEDRLMAALELNVNVVTVERYLRGMVRKEAFGLKLLGFLKARIANREKALA